MRTLQSVAAGAMCVAALVSLVFMGADVRADEIQDISKLLKQGQHAQAMDKANAYLAVKPKDAQGQFLKGLILAEQNKIPEAIRVFTALSEDYPELPEPYNNLAVLYAGQGQYDKAKTALEMAIRTHPSYATAYENLGDIYAKMASQAYDKALQLDKGNSAAQTKLTLIGNLFSGSSPQPARTSGKISAPSPVAAAAPSEARPPKPAAAVPTAAASQVPVPPAKPAPPAVATEKPAKAADPDPSGEVLKTVEEWAKNWSEQNAAKYFSFYSKDFKIPGGQSRAAWEKARKDRILKPKKIGVEVLNPEVKFTDASHAVVSFKQNYHSDTLKSSVTKTLSLVKENGEWHIQQERIGR